MSLLFLSAYYCLVLYVGIVMLSSIFHLVVLGTLVYAWNFTGMVLFLFWITNNGSNVKDNSQEYVNEGILESLRKGLYSNFSVQGR